ncbi:hypothetical protein DPMN_006634 [Dreissena polymorpha]|uniref:Uncharacterized protein n=1 Tax=Dreissena polymorpha TaxID=45954 RepID=A0A9D4RXK2_DREPO|nr:hypothetical protein DPMN_006634 [Dreissena polymorpha]
MRFSGDNLDVYVKTNHVGKEKKRHKDIPLFASNIIFSRVSSVDMSNVVPQVDASKLNSDSVLMKETDKAKLLGVYLMLFVLFSSPFRSLFS